MNTTVHEAIDTIDTHPQRHEMEQAIAEAERKYQHLSKSLLHLEDGRTIVSHEADCLLHIERMAKLAQRIAKGGEEVTRARSSTLAVLHGNRPVHHLTSLGQAIWTLCHEGIQLIEQACPSSCYRGSFSSPTIIGTKPPVLANTQIMQVRFNPYLRVLLRACQRTIPVIKAQGGYGLDLSSAMVRKKLDWLIRFVRRVCRSKAFRRIETNRVRLERKDLRSCCHYMASAFAQYSRLLVLRVDLYVRPEHKGWSESRLAAQCIRRYLRALGENRILPDVVRWVCKRECGFDRGIHYHLLVALDGHKHQSASALSQRLGEAWVNRCGHLRTSYFNCYTRRHQYAYNALGSVHLSNEWMLMGIREAIRYMVKGDSYVMTGHKRNLWKGIVPPVSKPTKRGAPRKAEHDMSLVDSILGNPTLKMQVPARDGGCKKSRAIACQHQGSCIPTPQSLYANSAWPGRAARIEGVADQRYCTV